MSLMRLKGLTSEFSIDIKTIEGGYEIIVSQLSFSVDPTGAFHKIRELTKETLDEVSEFISSFPLGPSCFIYEVCLHKALNTFTEEEHRFLNYIKSLDNDRGMTIRQSKA